MKYLILTMILFASGCGGLSLPDGSQFPSKNLTKHDSGILSTDKGLHLLLGMGTATVTRAIVQQTAPTWTRKEQMIAGCAAAATVGIAKELYDRDIMGSYAEPLDAVYTAAGCLFTFEWAF